MRGNSGSLKWGIILIVIGVVFLLHNYGILVRDFSRTPGLEDCLRVTVGTEEEVRAFLEAMDRILSSRRASEMFGIAAVASRHLDDEG